MDKMRREQPLSLALLEEIVIFLSFVGGATLFWVAAPGGKDWWHGALPPLMWAYPVRFAVELWTRHRGRPLLRLVPDDQ